MLNIAVLVSGGGTNLQALIDYEKSNKNCPYHIALVVSNTKSAYALERAKNASIPAEIRSPYSVLGKEKAEKATRDEKRIAISDAILELCQNNHIDAIVLAGYLSVLGGKILDVYKEKIINLHPALLPSYGGVGMWGHNVHEAVLANHEKESGCTVHIVDGGCDTGRILVQKKVPVMEDDTPDTLYARIAPHEHDALIEGVCMLAGECR